MLAALAALSLTAPARAAPSSSIVAVEVTRDEPAGTFGGVAFHRIEGVIHGEVAAGEPVAGLAEAAAGRPVLPYRTGFDLIAPTDPGQADGVLVEANNRGMGVILGMLSAPGPGRPTALGDGFLFAHRIAVAHIQWQTRLSPGVPQPPSFITEPLVIPALA